MAVHTTVRSRLMGLLHLLGRYRVAFLGATLFLGFSAAAKTGTYLLLGYFIDDVLGQAAADTTLLVLIALGFLGLALVEGAFTFWSGKLAASTAEGIVQRLRNTLFDQLQRLSFTYHDTTRTGELIQRASSDIDAIRRFYSEQAPGVGRIILLFVINFIAIYVINSRLALLSTVVVPLVVVLSMYFFRRISAAYELHQEQEAQLSTTLQENISAVRVVKAFARQEFEQQRFDHHNSNTFERGRYLLLQHSIFWPIADLLCGMQMLAGLLIGGFMALRGELSIGDFVAYAGLVVWMIWPMRELGRMIVQMSSGLVSYSRVAEVLAETQEPLDQATYQPQGTLQGALSFNNVDFVYSSGPPVLHSISFNVQPGEIVALLGATGSGKTSLVNLLPRFYDYTAGSIMLDGIELKAYSRDYLRTQIGIVAQEPFLFSRTIRENITYGVNHEASEAAIIAATTAAAAHDFIMSFPDGYDTLVGEKGVTLSGGQKQRLTIARTLLKNPPLLILDDATSSVDTETEAHIRAAMNGLMQGRTTFMIAHRITSVLHADQIIVLDQGRIVQHGTHAELLAQPGIYRRIFDLQEQIEYELEEEIAHV